eukprot:TRINITY_DN14646_c0_g1_i1.p1 TRINITY_DN14646_c0_g1~~TRINITY_DN14646_c0_g1_i1.p1  ORF type:complete len:94 (-),score=16.15 TRINITY_DN14646_c0_g1_i1:500-781(-)
MELDFLVELELTSPCLPDVSSVVNIQLSYQTVCPMAQFGASEHDWEVPTSVDTLPIAVLNQNDALQPWKQDGVVNPLIEKIQLQYKLSKNGRL